MEREGEFENGRFSCVIRKEGFILNTLVQMLKNIGVYMSCSATHVVPLEMKCCSRMLVNEKVM